MTINHISEAFDALAELDNNENKTKKLNESYKRKLREELDEKDSYVYEGGEIPENIKFNAESIIISNSVTEIGRERFAECNSLKSITIPNSVTKLGTGCFYNCYSLQSVTISDSVTKIGDECFYGCKSLDTLITSKGSTAEKYFKENYPSVNIKYSTNESYKRNNKLREELDEKESWEFTSKVYNALADIMYEYSPDVSRSDMDYALEWFNIHFWETEDFDESFNKKLKECINKLNEAEMSDEDKKDSEILWNIYNKTQNRANARLTPEEKEVLDKYGLTRNSDYKNIFKKTDTGNVDLIDNRVSRKGNNRYRLSRSRIEKSPNFKNQEKINLADRARKIDDRGSGYEGNFGYDNQNWHREYKDPETGRYKRLKNKGLLDRERSIENDKLQEPINTMKYALGDRKQSQSNLSNIEDRRQQQILDAEKEYNAKLARINRNHDWEKDYDQRQLDSANDTIDNLLKRK